MVFFIFPNISSYNNKKKSNSYRSMDKLKSLNNYFPPILFTSANRSILV